MFKNMVFFFIKEFSADSVICRLWGSSRDDWMCNEKDDWMSNGEAMGST